MYDTLEEQLNHFDRAQRREAFLSLAAAADANALKLPDMGAAFNLHCHSFFSFNGYGYSPAALVWNGRKLGLSAMALVDFDVLDGVDEFLDCARRLRLRAGAGMETRVYVPEFHDDEINSPGEPGVAYHVGIGFTGSQIKDPALLAHLKAMAQQRTKTVIEKVNTLLHEIALDYETEVLTLTPKNNPTERHVCLAYDRKARRLFADTERLVNFWCSKLDLPKEAVEKGIDAPPVFQGVIRSKTMKSGGVGYSAARGEDFPKLEAVNRFIGDNGAIPTFAFLDGFSSGEQQMDRLLEVMMAAGAAAVNIIPDRNWNIADPETRALKERNLDAFIAKARERDLPILVGTEMNAFGQKKVDDFDAPALKPYYQDFVKGMYILHGHTVLQGAAGLGYLSDWAQRSFASVSEKNNFYQAFGEHAAPDCHMSICAEATPKELLRQVTA